MRRLIVATLGLAVVAACFAFVLPRIADYGAAWHVIERLSVPQVGLLGLAVILNLVTFAPSWMVAIPGLGFGRAFVVTQASTASTYIAPGGAAVGVALSYAMLRRWGFTVGQVGLAAAVTGIWNQLALLGFPVVGLALLTVKKEQDALLQSVALLGLVVFALAVGAFAAALGTERLSRRMGDACARAVNWIMRRIGRRPVGWSGESFVRFRSSAIELLRRGWHFLTIATLAGQLTVFLLFLISLRVLGVSSHEVSAVEAFSAWALVRLLGSLPITPGGIGIVEVGMTTALVGFGGHNAEVVAAVLLYRFLSIVPTLMLGLAAGVIWRRLAPDASRTAPSH